MKKLIAALVAIPTIALAKVGALANVGEDVIKILTTHENDVMTLVRSLANQGDDVARVAGGLANQGDDVARVAGGFANQGDDVARIAGGVVNVKLNQPEVVVYNKVHEAILSGVNKDSIDLLMAKAEAANRKQYQQTGVLLNKAVLLMLVHQAAAASATTRD